MIRGPFYQKIEGHPTGWYCTFIDDLVRLGRISVGLNANDEVPAITVPLETLTTMVALAKKETGA